MFNRSQKIQKTNNYGKFIVIEGSDGSGKHTQAEKLAQTLRDNGYEVFECGFPQYKEVTGQLVSKYLNGEYRNANAKAVSILYAVDRFNGSTQIQEALDQGKIVVCDRYYLSNAGHQGSKIENKDARISFYKWLQELEFEVFEIPKPHLNIILSVPAEVSLQLLKKRNLDQNRSTDIHESDINHLNRAVEVYNELSELIPNTKQINCYKDGQLLSIEAIHAQVWELVRRLVLNK
ncbi:MAG: dTMP kinase [Candidatus Doudnabacteria bacterium]